MARHKRTIDERRGRTGTTRPIRHGGNAMVLRLAIATLVLLCSGLAHGKESCFPACRAGFVCHEGRCLSRCNPVCEAGQVCTDVGTCVSALAPPRPGVVATEPGVVAKSNPPARDSIVGLYANTLGVLQFGLTPTLELGTKASGFLRARVLNTGALPYVLATLDGDTFKYGYGVAAGFRYYFGSAGNLRGFYLGVAGEYLCFVSEDNEVNDRYVSKFVIPQGELGYRWVFRSDVTLGFGVNAGYAINVVAETKPKDGSFSYVYENTAGNMPFGMLVLELGFLI